MAYARARARVGELLKERDVYMFLLRHDELQ